MYYFNNASSSHAPLWTTRRRERNFMSEITKEIIKTLPRWVFTVAFLALVIFMAMSFFLGTPFMIAGKEFGFSRKNKEVESNKEPILVSYRVQGTVETAGKGNPHEVLISPQYPPLYPSAQGSIVGLYVWKGPDGKFPKLNFSHPDYWEIPINLNDTDKVQIVPDSIDPRIIIKEPIKLIPKETK